MWKTKEVGEFERQKEGTGISEKKMDNSRNSYHVCFVFRSFWLGKNCYRRNFLTVTTVGCKNIFHISIFPGLFNGILGPTLLDIEQLTGTTTAQVSLMFTAMTVGAMIVGAPLGNQRGCFTIFLLMTHSIMEF